jgi:hypothetical protein
VIAAAVTAGASCSSLLVHRRNPGCDGIVGYIADDYCVGTDNHIVTHLDGAENLGPGADVHVVADHRCARLINSAQPDYDAVKDTAVVAELRIAADPNSAEVVDEVSTNLGFARQFNPGNDLNQLES